jgi:glycosyltransferase involved in cell wall biosynthesis
MSVAASRSAREVFFFPASFSYYPVIGSPVVVTVHDAISERMPHLTMPNRRARAYWRVKQRLAVGQARTIITVSEASRTSLADELRIPYDKMHVVREAAADIFSADSHGRSRSTDGEARYFLYVGGMSPHKNVGVLIEAFDRLAVNERDVRLVLVGETDREPFLSDLPSLRDAIAASAAASRVVFAGYVPDDELVDLYRGAVALILPSLGEGYGLPAAEAAACGTPVVASSDAALIELLGDAGLFFQPQDVKALVKHLGCLLTDRTLREDLSRRCLARARMWSWADAADRTIEIIEKAAHR